MTYSDDLALRFTSTCQLAWPKEASYGVTRPQRSLITTKPRRYANIAIVTSQPRRDRALSEGTTHADSSRVIRFLMKNIESSQ